MNMPEHEINKLENILGENFNLAAANGTKTPYKGEDGNHEKLFPDLTVNGSKILIDLIIEEERQDIHFSTVEVAKIDCMVPKGQAINATCRADYFSMERKTPVSFEPIESSNLPTGLLVSENLKVLNRG